MADFYPDPPGPRVTYDRDGSTAVQLDGSGNYVGDLTQAQVETINDESDDHYAVGSGWVAVIFPQLMDVSHTLFVKAETGYTRGPEWSADTTNGEDGTWTAFGDGTDQTNNELHWRDGWREVNLTGVKAIRYGASSSHSTRDNVRAVHFYGAPSSAPTDGLWLWKAATDVLLDGTEFDFGDLAQDSQHSEPFRVHNYGSEVATAVEVSAEALTYADYVPYVEFSDDAGSTWAATLSIGDLAAGATSGEILVRLTVPDGADLGKWTVRIVAEETGS